MKKSIFTTFTFFMFVTSVKAQDTLTYEGLIMARVYIGQKNKFRYFTKRNYDFDYLNHITFLDFFVLTDTFFNYDQAIEKGVFFGSREKNRNEVKEVSIMRKVAQNYFDKKKIPTEQRKTFPEFVYATNDPFLYPFVQKKSGLFWAKHQYTIYEEVQPVITGPHADRIFRKKVKREELPKRKYFFEYNVYSCKIKYIPIGNVEFEIANRKAKNEKKAFIKYNVMGNFITEIIHLEYFDVWKYTQR